MATPVTAPTVAPAQVAPASPAVPAAPVATAPAAKEAEAEKALLLAAAARAQAALPPAQRAPLPASPVAAPPQLPKAAALASAAAPTPSLAKPLAAAAPTDTLGVKSLLEMTADARKAGTPTVEPMEAAARARGLTLDEYREKTQLHGMDVDALVEEVVMGRGVDNVLDAAQRRGAGLVSTEAAEAAREKLAARIAEIAPAQGLPPLERAKVITKGGVVQSAKKYGIMGTEELPQEAGRADEAAGALAWTILKSAEDGDGDKGRNLMVEIPELLGEDPLGGMGMITARANYLRSQEEARVGRMLTDEEDRSLIALATYEMAAKRTANLYYHPLFLPSTLDPTKMGWIDSLAPNVEVLGLDNEGNPVLRSATAWRAFFDLVDTPQSMATGVAKGAGDIHSLGDLAEQARQGIARKDNVLEGAMAAPWAQVKTRGAEQTDVDAAVAAGATGEDVPALGSTIRTKQWRPFLAAGLSLPALILFPDMLSLAGKPFTATARLTRAAQNQSLAKAAVGLLHGSAEARTSAVMANRLADIARRTGDEAKAAEHLAEATRLEGAAAAADVELRRVAPDIAQQLDIIDARFGERTADALISPRWHEQNLPAEQAKHLDALHPAERRLVLRLRSAGAEAENVADFPSTFNFTERLERLRGYARQLAAIPEEQRVVRSVAAATSLPKSLGTLLDPAGGNADIAAFIARVVAESPKFAKGAEGDAILEGWRDALRVLLPGEKGTGDANAAIRGKFIALMRGIQGKATKAETAVDPLDAVERVIEAVTTHQESRAAAALTLRTRLAREGKIRAPVFALGRVQEMAERGLADISTDIADGTPGGIAALTLGGAAGRVKAAVKTAVGATVGKAAAKVPRGKKAAAAAAASAKADAAAIALSKARGEASQLLSARGVDLFEEFVAAGADPDVALASSVITEARGKVWASATGGKLADWYVQHIAGVVKVPAPAAGQTAEEAFEAARAAARQRFEAGGASAGAGDEPLFQADDAADAPAAPLDHPDRAMAFDLVDEAGIAALRRGGTAQAAAAWMTGHAHSPATRAVAAILARTPGLDRVPLRVLDDVDFAREPGRRLVGGGYQGVQRSGYSPKSGDVILATVVDESTVVHEIVHAATAQRLKVGLAGTELVDPKLARAAAEMQDLYGHVLSVAGDMPDTSQYGLTNIFEFVAEGMSNPEFQSLLRSIMVAPGKSESLWDSFLRLVGRLLGAEEGDADALSAFFARYQDLVEAPYSPEAMRFVPKGKDRALHSPGGGVGATTPDDIHRIADDLGIPWDDDPDFLKMSKSVTGKAKLDDMTPAELQKLAEAMSSGRKAAAASTDTPEFRNWFGDSKIVDPDGKPLVLYHGGFNTEVDDWKRGSPRVSGRGALGVGHYLTGDPKVAAQYVTDPAHAVTESYVSMKKPLWLIEPAPTNDIFAGGRINLAYPVHDAYTNGLIALGMPKEKAVAAVEKAIESQGWPPSELLRKMAMEQGYDGLVRSTSQGKFSEVVVWSPQQVKSTQNTGTWGRSDPRRLHQEAGAGAQAGATPAAPPRGAMEFLDDGRAIIYLFENADSSTAIHELGHVFRSDLERVAATLGRASQEAADLDTAAEWAGATRAADGAWQWATAAEEKFARGFERYLRGGKAPTAALGRVFQQFKTWLIGVYRSITGSAIDIDVTPEVRAVFDRLLATREELARQSSPMAPNEALRMTRQMMEGDPYPKLSRSIQRELWGTDPDHDAPFPFAAVLAAEARKAGVKLRIDGEEVSATATRISDLTESGRIVEFTGDVMGHYEWDPKSVRSVQGEMDAERLVERGQLRTLPVSGAHEGVNEVSASRTLESLVHTPEGEKPSLGRSFARWHLNALIGDNEVSAYMNLPPWGRHAVKSGIRIISNTTASAIRITREKGQNVEKLLRFLGGEVVHFEDGSSPARAVDVTTSAAAQIRYRFESMQTEHRQNLLGFIDLLRGGLSGTTDLEPRHTAAIYDFFYGKGSNDVLKLLLEAVDAPAAAVSAETLKLRGQERRLVDTLLTFGGVVPHRGQAPVTGVDRARFIFDEMHDLYGPGEAMRSSVVLGSLGATDEAYRKIAGMGLGIETDVISAFKQWVNGEEVPTEMLPRVREMASRFGFDPRIMEEAVLTGTVHLPQAAVVAVNRALVKAAGDPVKRFGGWENRGMGDLVRNMLQFIKARQVRGGWILRTRHFTMNTFDDFTQIAMVAGLAPAFANLARVAAQDLITVPFAARLLWVAGRVGQVTGLETAGVKVGSRVFRPLSMENIEGFRRALSNAGDAGARIVQTFLQRSKWHGSVNDLLDSTEGTIRLGDAVYSRQQVRDIFVEEGIFENFFTESLARSMEDVVRVEEGRAVRSGALGGDRGRVREFFSGFYESVADLSEAWSERERVGAALGFMEQGMDPRSAARLTVKGLWDYSGSMSAFDRNLLVGILLPYWAFQKNANRMIIDHMFSPWGAYRMGALRRAAEGVPDAISSLLYSGTTEPYGVDVELLPENSRRAYWTFRRLIEHGYGPWENWTAEEQQEFLQGLRNAPFGKQYRGPSNGVPRWEDLPPDFQERIQYGYGGPENVPEDVRIALVAILAGTTRVMQGDRAYTLDAALHRASALGGMFTYPARASAPRGKAQRPGWAEGMPAVTLPPLLGEESRGISGIAGYQHHYLDLLLPEPVIVSGMRHIAGVIATELLLAQKAVDATGWIVEGEGTQWVPLTEPLSDVVDPFRAPLVSDVLGIYDDSRQIPTRVHPGIARMLESAFGITLYRGQAIEDPNAPGGFFKEGQPYILPGPLATGFNNSPVGELNQLLLAGKPGTTEQALAADSPALGWALAFYRRGLGLRTLDSHEAGVAGSDETRYSRETTTPSPRGP